MSRASRPRSWAGRLAVVTRRIRVGAGGVLLPDHAPIVVAEQFGTLEAFFPGRIDLSLGRALGGPAYVAEAVRRGGEDFPGQVDELIGYFADGDGRIRAVPALGHRPRCGCSAPGRAPPRWLASGTSRTRSRTTSTPEAPKKRSARTGTPVLRW
ncbi:LLM class flavin-dependent oxidoreductase [Amycolatopsis sp. FDAARGOS 1241]|uniref:LLM class flavin-dependent oxidoreductase n=1 Tax=Amycolatopsis sp. FDAARGOS 1241 TaxID=2778070 RepID=UPI00351C8FCC